MSSLEDTTLKNILDIFFLPIQYKHNFFILFAKRLSLKLSNYRDNVYQCITSQPKAGQNTQQHSTRRAGRDIQPTNKPEKLYRALHVNE